jgi:hypothetical protein
VAVDAFNARRSQSFWRDLRAELLMWDESIREFNAATGVTVS